MGRDYRREDDIHDRRRTERGEERGRERMPSRDRRHGGSPRRHRSRDVDAGHRRGNRRSSTPPRHRWRRRSRSRSRSRDGNRRRRRRSASSSSDYGGYVPRQRHRGKDNRASGAANRGAAPQSLGLDKPAAQADPAITQAERQRRAQQWILEQQAASLNVVRADGSKEQGGNRLAREVYVGNLLVGVVNAESLRQFFDSSMAVAFPSDNPFVKPVIEVRMSHDLKFAFVELRTEEMATAALQLNGTNLCGRAMVIARPSGYVDSIAVAQLAASKLAESERQQHQQPTTATDVVDRQPTEKAKSEQSPVESCVVCLGNLVTESDLVAEEEYKDVCEDVLQECSKSGQVIELRIPRNSIDANIKCNAFVRFATAAEAKAAVNLFNGRKFDGRSVSAVLWPEEDFDELPPASFS